MAQDKPELTIFWAEWDPANYLQELVNEYPDATVTVETTPWGDFQTKAFTEFNAQGDAYDMVVGDSQWLGAASTGGHYVDLTDFFTEHNLTEVMAPATMTYYSEYPKGSAKYWSVPLEGDAVGWAYRKDWFEDPDEMAAFKAKYGYDLAVPKTGSSCATSPSSSTGRTPDPPMYGIAIYTAGRYDALAMGFENALFSFGGELGDYATCKVQGIVNSPQAVQALEAYKELYRLHAAELGQDVLPGEQPGDHRGPGGDEHELLRLLPGARQPGDQPERRRHRLLRQSRPARTASSSPRSAGRASPSSPIRTSRRNRRSSWSGSSRTTCRSAGPSSAATPRTRRRWSRRSSATPRPTTKPSTRRCSS